MLNKIIKPGKTSFILAAIYILILALPAFASENDFASLYKLAKAKDPQLARSQARFDVSIADKDIAFASILPHISANGSVKQFWHNVEGYASGPINGEYTGYSYGAGGNLYLLNMPSYFQIKAAKTGIDSSKANIKAVESDLVIRLVDAYIRALKSSADEKLYRDERTRMSKLLEQAEAFLKAGTGDIIAVYETKAKLDSAAADLVKAEAGLKMALQQLSTLTGVLVENIKDITVEKALPPEPENIDWWIETMRSKNPSIQQAILDLKQSQQNTSSARGGHYPTIQANGGYTVDKGSTFLPNVETQQWYTGVGINIPIYSGGETKARVVRSVAAEKERRAILDDTQDQAVKKLKETYLNLQYTKTLAEAYQKKKESAKMQLDAVQKGRALGTRTAIDIINSEQSYSIALRDIANAMYDNLQRRIELQAAAGILNATEVVELFR